MSEAEEFYKKSRAAFKAGKNLEALAFIEKAFNIEPDDPKYQSFLALCIAHERGQIKEAIKLSEKAVQADPLTADNYLNLGKIYLRAGLKQQAIDTLRKGMGIDKKNPEIIAELEVLGARKKPVISFLPRSNFLNKYLGIIFSRLGLRS